MKLAYIKEKLSHLTDIKMNKIGPIFNQIPLLGCMHGIWHKVSRKKLVFFMDIYLSSYPITY